MDPTSLILDIQEKEPAAPKAPTFPQIGTSTSGFPEHKKRTRVSAFKKRRNGEPVEEKKSAVFTTSSQGPVPLENDARHSKVPTTEPSGSRMGEQQRIDRENNERLASMSPEEIESARQELFGSLDSKTLEMLLKRSNLDDSKAPDPFETPSPNPPTTQDFPQTTAPEIRVEDTSIPKRNLQATVTEESQEEEVPSAINTSASSAAAAAAAAAAADDDSAKPQTQQPTRVDETAPPEPPAEHIPPADVKPHWPRQRQPDDLDPSDPNFLESLHDKYFPHLPADPAKLSWMAPIPTPNSPADFDSPYHPMHSSLPVSALRFDFRGVLLPPRIARAVPTTKGLHHHGEAPEAAGYTIPELARLTRSAVPGQRCIAYQTLGRILFRLGRGELSGADPDGDRGDVPLGVWRQVEEGRVLRSLYDEAAMEEGRKGYHRSARAFAVEALWLLEKGGWKERYRRATK